MKRILVGGPARCGKTTTARLLGTQNQDCLYLGVDALFPAMLRRPLLNRIRSCRDTVAHFLSRPRYQDDDRLVTESALTYSPVALETLLNNAGIKQGDHPVAAYGRTIDAMATAQGATAWIAFDVHPEFRFHVLRHMIPGLQLLLVFRDPLEAIAAQIYWRQDSSYRHSRKRFRRAFLLWALSAQVAIDLRRKHPADVAVLALPDVLDNAGERAVFGVPLHRPANTIKTPDLLYSKHATGYRLPNGTIAPLLSEAEEQAIATLLFPLAVHLGLDVRSAPSGHKPRAPALLIAYMTGLKWLSRLRPSLALTVLDFADNPVAVLRGQLSYLRDALGAAMRRKSPNTSLPE